ncbi:MAG TPA: class I SAM-dependent methyltransferase [Candidatus Paceibacterota bacterium]
MTTQELRERLDFLNKKTNTEWVASLDERKKQELEFHNIDKDKTLGEDEREKLHANRKFYTTTQVSNDYVQNWIATHAKGKVFLDYACGDGLNAVAAAKAGAELAIGLDISDVSVENGRRLAAQEGVSANSFFLQGDCENTGLPDNCIDACICSGMLHHLDLSYAFYELRRILKPGGVILAVEALDCNPAIKAYRMLTPHLRTDWEKAHILSYKEVSFAKRFFDVKEIKHWHLFSIAAAYVPSALPFLNSLDKFVLNLPFIKLMSWMFTFELHKK